MVPQLICRDTLKARVGEDSVTSTSMTSFAVVVHVACMETMNRKVLDHTVRQRGKDRNIHVVVVDAVGRMLLHLGGEVVGTCSPS